MPRSRGWWRRAEPDTILVSAAAAPALERRFELVPVGPVDSRGGSSYRLEGLERPGLAPRGPMTPLVGRGPELEQLRHALARAAAGHGQVVAIVGEPGVGKSRLVWEVMRAHRDQGWLIGHGTAVSYGQATPYLPMIDLLRAYFHVEDRDDPPQIREKVMARLLALDRALESSLPALLALLDVAVDDGPWQALDPQQRRQRTLEAIKRLWLREARVQPVLLVVEDLHWVDSETQALLDSLVESLPSARLCLLVDYRPEYQHGWGSKTSYTQQRLDPLPPDSARELLQRSSATMPASSASRRSSSSGPRGIRSSWRRPCRRWSRPEPWVASGERITWLGRSTRSKCRRRSRPSWPLESTGSRPRPGGCSRRPSVVGKDVPFALLQAIADVPEDALRRGLATLQAAEFLYEAGIFPDHEYTFKHALTHDVAYGSLLQDRRRRLHGQIVETVERLYPDRLAEHVERLAHHAFRAEAWEKAVTYLRQAGAKAFARSANRDAVAYFEQALTALTHLPETRETQEQAIDLRFGLRNAWSHASGIRPGRSVSPRSGGPGHHTRRSASAGMGVGLYGRLLRDRHLAHDRRAHVRPTGRGHRRGARRCAAPGRSPPLPSPRRLHVGRLSGNRRRLPELDGVPAGRPAGERFGLPQSPAVLAHAFLARALAERGCSTRARLTDGKPSGSRKRPITRPASSRRCWGSRISTMSGGSSARPSSARTRGRSVPRLECLIFAHAMASLGHVYAASGRVGDGLSLLRQAVTAHESAGIGYFHSISVLQLGEAYLLADQLEAPALRPTAA